MKYGYSIMFQRPNNSPCRSRIWAFHGWSNSRLKSMYTEKNMDIDFEIRKIFSLASEDKQLIKNIPLIWCANEEWHLKNLAKKSAKRCSLLEGKCTYWQGRQVHILKNLGFECVAHSPYLSGFVPSIFLLPNLKTGWNWWTFTNWGDVNKVGFQQNFFWKIKET